MSKNTAIHFHSADERCCRAPGPRRFTLSADEVTCPACIASYDRDRFILSADGAAVVAASLREAEQLHDVLTVAGAIT